MTCSLPSQSATATRAGDTTPAIAAYPIRGNDARGTVELTQPSQPASFQSVTPGDTGRKTDGSETRGRESLINWKVSSDDPKKKPYTKIP